MSGLALTLNGDWADTTLDLPAGVWHDVLSGAEGLDGRVALAVITVMRF